MDVSQKKNSKKQGKMVEVTGVGPKDDYTSNGAMASEQKRRIEWGIAIPGSAKAMRGRRKRKR